MQLFTGTCAAACLGLEVGKGRNSDTSLEIITMKEPSIYCLALLQHGAKDHYSAKAFPRVNFGRNRDVADSWHIFGSGLCK